MQIYIFRGANANFTSTHLLYPYQVQLLFYFLDSILSTPVSSTNSDPKRILSLVQVILNVKTAMTDLQPALSDQVSL